MKPDKFALITGARSGIGRAIALDLCSQGASLILVSRRLDSLKKVVSEANIETSKITFYQADLSIDTEIKNLVSEINHEFNRLDILIHSAGVISFGPLMGSPTGDFYNQFKVNVLAPHVLTQGLIPLIKEAHGQIVFINSSVSLRTRKNTGFYAATKHALKAYADTLRLELNPEDVRVLSVYPGRTASAMQKKLHLIEGKDYQPERLMHPEDLAHVITNALKLPRTAEVTDLMIRPMLGGSS